PRRELVDIVGHTNPKLSANAALSAQLTKSSLEPSPSARAVARSPTDAEHDPGPQKARPEP
ncbi:MAG: hypothetical protein AAFV29_23760, partial [Myxococcota bacterium]